MEPEQVIHVVVKIITNNYNKGIGLDALCPLNWIWMFPNQQARSQGTIMFKVVPITERPVHQKMMVGRPPRQLLHPLIPSSSHLSRPAPQLYVRAMVNYNPQQDPTIPCADAGVSFSKGDILEIVDQTDALWWQARRLPSDACCAGLIPSSSLLKRCEMLPRSETCLELLRKLLALFFLKTKITRF